LLTADYAFGHALERDVEAVVLENGTPRGEDQREERTGRGLDFTVTLPLHIDVPGT